MDRAGERAGPEDVGDETLIRGLLAAFPFFRPGLSLSKLGRRSGDRPHSPIGSSPAVVPPSLLHDGCHAGRTSARRRKAAPVPAPVPQEHCVDEVAFAHGGFFGLNSSSPWTIEHERR
jgi:hypothetical protein